MRAAGNWQGSVKPYTGCVPRLTVRDFHESPDVWLPLRAGGNSNPCWVSLRVKCFLKPLTDSRTIYSCAVSSPSAHRLAPSRAVREERGRGRAPWARTASSQGSGLHWLWIPESTTATNGVLLASRFCQGQVFPVLTLFILWQLAAPLVMYVSGSFYKLTFWKNSLLFR